jgi:hypothetical protein
MCTSQNSNTEGKHDSLTSDAVIQTKNSVNIGISSPTVPQGHEVQTSKSTSI